MLAPSGRQRIKGRLQRAEMVATSENRGGSTYRGLGWRGGAKAVISALLSFAPFELAGKMHAGRAWHQRSVNNISARDIKKRRKKKGGGGVPACAFVCGSVCLPLDCEVVFFLKTGGIIDEWGTSKPP